MNKAGLIFLVIFFSLCLIISLIISLIYLIKERIHKYNNTPSKKQIDKFYNTSNVAQTERVKQGKGFKTLQPKFSKFEKPEDDKYYIPLKF